MNFLRVILLPFPFVSVLIFFHFLSTKNTNYVKGVKFFIICSVRTPLKGILFFFFFKFVNGLEEE